MTKSQRKADLHRSLIAAVIWSLVTAGPTTANDFGSDWQHTCDNTYASQCVANNATHLVQFFDMDNNNLLAASRQEMVDYNTGAGALTMTEVTSNADANVQDIAVGAVGWWAATYCSNTASYGGNVADHTRWCRPQILTYNLSYSAGVAQPYYLACHELGHTVGLRHTSNIASCMKYPGDTSGLSGDFIAHERDHLNARYGN